MCCMGDPHPQGGEQTAAATRNPWTTISEAIAGAFHPLRTRTKSSKPPVSASRAQIAGMTIAAALGAVGGFIAFIVAENNGISDERIWIPFVICEGSALVVVGVVLHLQLQRSKSISTALSFVMNLEAHMEGQEAGANEPSAPLSKPVRDKALSWRDLLVASHDFELAERLMKAVRMRDEEAQRHSPESATPRVQGQGG